MKYQRSAASLALAVLVVLGLAGPAAAGEQVPFKGRLEGLDTAIPIPKTPFVAVTVKATGNATHLGKFTLTLLATVNTVTRTGTGTFLFTAANGDTVFGTGSGKATLTAPGVLTIVEKGIITGGTGRFAGATGSFTLTILHSTIVNNRADGGAAGTGGSDGFGRGGGINIVPGGIVCVDLVTNITNNEASTSDDDVFGDLCFI